MKKLFCLGLMAAFCFAAGCDFDDIDKEFAEDGDLCDNRGDSFCRNSLLFTCLADEDDSWTDMFEDWCDEGDKDCKPPTVSNDVLILKYKSESCGQGQYCKTYDGKSGCFERCSEAELNQRHPENSRMICTKIADDEYFFVY